MIFVNRWTDAPNAIATCVTTRCLSARNAIIMSAFFNFLGVFIMTQINSSVASTISNMVDFGDSTQNALVALCAAPALHCRIQRGGVHFRDPHQREPQPHRRSFGSGHRHPARHRRHQRAEWVKVLYGLVLSLVLGFGTGWVVCKIISFICRDMDRRRTNRFFGFAQIAGAAAMSFMHGAQDGQKFIGVLFLGAAFAHGQNSVSGMEIPVWLMLLCSVVMALGTSVGGEKRSLNPWAWTW